MRYYPIHLDLKERRVLVVGGGSVAESKIRQLVDAGARVLVVTLELINSLQGLAETGVINVRIGEFEEGDLDGILLVISATNDREANQTVAAAASGHGVLCNVVDEPDLCDFITPALVLRGDLQIGISTGGGSPTLAQRVKREIAELIGEEYGEFLQLASAMRAEAKQVIPNFEERRERLRAFVESEGLDLLRRGQRQEAIDLASQILKGDYVNATSSPFGS
ncbi:MAG: bifunctional precorrin-2 dehydrogenase/sirohydrochlorin ferrochelatase [Acidobacteriota bacterium]